MGSGEHVVGDWGYKKNKINKANKKTHDGVRLFCFLCLWSVDVVCRGVIFLLSHPCYTR